MEQPIEKPEFPREGQGHNGTFTGYTVEARYNYHAPAQVANMLLDNRWRKVNFPRADFGVPIGPDYQAEHLASLGLLGYASAQALRWWFHAEASATNMGGLCVETRLVEHQVAYSTKATATKAVMHIHGEDRSNCIPDWGKKEPQP